MRASGAPPVVPTKYTLVRNVGSLLLRLGNSCRKNRDDLPLMSLTRRCMPKCGSTLTVPLNVIWQDFQCFDFCLVLLAGLPDNFLQTGFNRPDQHLSSLVGTPHHMVVACKQHVPVAPIFLNHCSSILRWTI